MLSEAGPGGEKGALGEDRARMHEKVTTAQQLLVHQGVKPFQIDALLRSVRPKDRVAPDASADTLAGYYTPP
eukprot:COSAG06_NODE_3459_length_5313_cov_30.197545_3_plen_72_part_00